MRTRSLADVNETDDDGNAILDENGDQLVTLGLKSSGKTEQKKLQQPCFLSTIGI